MKIALIMSMVTSALLAGIVETNNGMFLELFTYKNSTEIVSKVPIAKGKIEKKNCYSTRNGQVWCKVTYTREGMVIKGYSEKKYLDIIAQAPNTKSTFEQTYGGKYDDVAKDIIAIKDGYLIVGETQSFGEGNSDTYIIKVDKLGNKIFSAAYGGRNADVANAVVEVNDGFMLAGTTSSFGNRIQSLYLSKIAKNGNLMWQKAYYSDKDDYYAGNDIVKISDTNMLIAGAEDHVKFFSSEVNIYLNAINTNGERNGIKRYGGEDPERAHSIIAVNDGYVIAGESDTWGHGRIDAYVIKIDKDGNRVWHNAFGFEDDEVANEIIATRDGGYILVGTTDSHYRTQKNVYVVKLSADGTREWQSFYGSREDDEGFGIVETGDGYVIAGYTKGTNNYDSDVYLLKIDRNGSVVWEKRYGSSKDDRANAIIKVEGGFVVAGYSTSIESYSKDVYLLKIDENGNIK
jgi:TolB-like protein